MIKIVHIGDLHLGGAYPEKAAASIDFLIEQMNDPTSPAGIPDMIICTGDTTERGLHVHSEHVRPLIKLIGSCSAFHPPLLFLQGTPTHEPYGFLDNLCDASGRWFTTLTEPMVSRFETKAGAINLAALPAISRVTLAQWATDLLGAEFDSPEENIRQILLSIKEQWKNVVGPKILLGHWTVTGCKTPSGQTLYGSDLSIGLDDIALAGADAVLLGHIHHAQDWREPVFTSYCGSSHPCNWGERDPKSFSVLEIDDAGKVANFVRIPYPHKPMTKIDIEFTGEQAPDGSFICDFSDPDDSMRQSEVKVCYTIPREIAAHVDDMYVRLMFHRIGIELAEVERTIRATGRERIANIADHQTTRQQYEATCAAKNEEPRVGALAKADIIDRKVTV